MKAANMSASNFYRFEADALKDLIVGCSTICKLQYKFLSLKVTHCSSVDKELELLNVLVGNILCIMYLAKRMNLQNYP